MYPDSCVLSRKCFGDHMFNQKLRNRIARWIKVSLIVKCLGNRKKNLIIQKWMKKSAGNSPRNLVFPENYIYQDATNAKLRHSPNSKSKERKTERKGYKAVLTRSAFRTNSVGLGHSRQCPILSHAVGLTKETVRREMSRSGEDNASVQELIRRKRDGEKLSKQEIRLFVRGVKSGSIQEGQIGALRFDRLRW